MLATSNNDSVGVAGHLIALMEIRDKMKIIHRKTEEVTVRLQHALAPIEHGSIAPTLQLPETHGDSHATLMALKELDTMLGQPDLITRDELRSRIQDLIRQLSE